ncbi:type II toxin-antitoxin system antitoxin SocA domain-containing protein [Pedobacter rhodius]|uniref:DUF4065 domain-containing protein n=1 Tax=Pedobacter rhodius TaxID=3004098 RepID=A0ABT4L4F8_9SPHI|nr:type II toxin-antitoxin system antitoxin SocA domain-containing protein [Pedobacter sp. SJ11]MCZ4224938.1 DUF4065 domain-containing protein [Pedobacter sp. SJ11]
MNQISKMAVHPKIPPFDYIVSKLKAWHSDLNPNNDADDLSKLKIMKLLFFVVAISSNRDQEGLLQTFDNFMALPYGHVESDIYANIDNSESYLFNDISLNLKPNSQPTDVDIELKDTIDNAINKLRLANQNLINYRAFDLVDISHKWQSWKTMYSLARKSGRYSMVIPKEMIMTELKTFVL